MSRQERLNKMRNLAQRVVQRSRIDRTQFREYPDDFLRNRITAWTEGSVGGLRFAAWLPVANELHGQEDMRSALLDRVQLMWRVHAFDFTSVHAYWSQGKATRMSEYHEHICPKCKEVYSCTDDRPIDSTSHGGPADSVCFHHYGVPHDTCATVQERQEVVVLGGY